FLFLPLSVSRHLQQHVFLRPSVPVGGTRRHRMSGVENASARIGGPVKKLHGFLPEEVPMKVLAEA
ncbi:MAG: hypothetical protein ACM337_02255, partial [Syntrophaceae bacterium]